MERSVSIFTVLNVNIFWYLFFYCNVYLNHIVYSPFMWQTFYEKIYFLFLLIPNLYGYIQLKKKRNITLFIILSKIFTRLSLAWHSCLFFSIFFISEIIIISMVSIIRISATDWLISCVSLYIFSDQCLLFPFYTVHCLSLFSFGSTVCQNSSMNRMPRAEFIVDCGDRPDIAGATAKVWWIKRK